MFLLLWVSLPEGITKSWQEPVFGTSAITPSKAGAEPAPIFSSLIDDIRTQLPKGLKMRLPSALPSPPPNVKLYPYIRSDNKIFEVRLAITPDCAFSDKPAACTVGAIGVFTPEGSKIWPPKGDSITPVDLGHDTHGFYVTRGEGDNISQYVFWQQDGLEYAVGLGSGSTKIVSQQQTLDIATSTVNEPAITSTH